MSNQATRLAEEARKLAEDFGDACYHRRSNKYAVHTAMVAAIDALLALVQPAVSEEARWLPIETAPTTGRILVFDGEVAIAWWDDNRGEWWADGADWTDAVGQPLYPTRWMPLPEAPATRAQSSSKGDEGMQHE